MFAFLFNNNKIDCFQLTQVCYFVHLCVKLAVLMCVSAPSESQSKNGKSGKRVAPAAEANAVAAKRGLFSYCGVQCSRLDVSLPVSR